MKSILAMLAFRVFLIAVVVAGLLKLAGCASNSECLKCPGQCDLQRSTCPKGEVK